MCLGTKLSDRSLARYKAKGKKRGYIKVWKVVKNTGKKFTPEFTPYYGCYEPTGGLARAWAQAINEDQTIHAYRHKEGVRPWQDDGKIIIQAFVHPDWVKAISLDALTTKAIVMPAYPKRKVTVAEFRAAIKGKKIQTYCWE